MQILDEIDAVFRDLRIEEIEGGVDVGLQMAAIVDDDVGRPEFLHQRGQEREVVLPADADLHRAVFELFAARIDVDADDGREWAEIAPPQL